MATTEIMQLHSAGEEPKPRFDYRGRHRYVVTLETLEARPVFAGREEVRAVLGALRDQSLAHHFEVLIYTFQPSTLTLLIRGKEEGANMKLFLAAFRLAAAAATAATTGPRLWKRTYRERVLRKTEELRNVIREVAMIPVRAGLAPHPLAYEFQGSFVDELSSLLPRPGGSSGSRPQHSFGTGHNDRSKFSNQPGGPHRSNQPGRTQGSNPAGGFHRSNQSGGSHRSNQPGRSQGSNQPGHPNGSPRRDGRTDVRKKRPNR